MLLKQFFAGVFLLTSVSAFALEDCGTTGTVNQRIKDCGNQKKQSFVLVARISYPKLKETFEVYKDLRTKLLWSDRLRSNTMNFTNAVVACDYEVRKEMANISDVNWTLPSADMYKEAVRSGIVSALPNMQEFFWTSTEKYGDPVRAYMFNGAMVDFTTYSKNNGAARVRCVAQTY